MTKHTSGDGGTDTATPVLRDKSFWSVALVGLAVMAAVDEIVFHQILGWHHLYDRSTPQIGLLSDGLLHAAELVALVAGFFLWADARRRGRFSASAAWAGFFVGAGAFQLWDATINHKVLGLHQVRYGVDLAPYDLAWAASGATLLLIGVVLTVTAMRRQRSSD